MYHFQSFSIFVIYWRIFFFFLIAGTLLWGMRNCFLGDVEDGYYRPARFRANQVIAALLSVTFLTLFIGSHITLFGTTVYQIQVQQYPSVLSEQDFLFVDEIAPTNSSADELQNDNVTSRKKLHFSKTKRRLPQVKLFSRNLDFETR